MSFASQSPEAWALRIELEGVKSDLQANQERILAYRKRARELATDQVRDWLKHKRGVVYRDGGATAAVVEALEYLCWLGNVEP